MKRLPSLANPVLLLIALFCCAPALDSQVVATPCEGLEIELTNLALSGLAGQSSTFGFGASNTGEASRSIDGITNGDETNTSRTLAQANPWWEVDLGASYLLRGLQIWYPENHYPSGLGNYYILVSPFPFSGTELSTELSSPFVEHVYVQASWPSGSEIPLEYRQARYVRIQLDGFGDLALFEIGIPGGGAGELCGNGIDDDCDGKIDCADPDCGPTLFNVQATDPTCPICRDGEIQIQAFGEDLSYSIDGGLTFESFPPPTQIQTFDDLLEGSYQLVVANEICTLSYVNNPVIIQAPQGTPNGCCDNGDFESGNFDNWTGGLGTRDEGSGATNFDNTDLQTESPNMNIPDELAARHYIISQTSGYEDPILGFLPLFGGNSGMYLARLGNRFAGAKAERLTYCFEVTDCNSNFYFNYSVVFQDPEHNLDQQPYFQYIIWDATTNEPPIDSAKIIAEGDNLFFKKFHPENSDDVVLYTDWTCVDIDLSNRLGHEVCIEFITADCSEGAHFGYAYIDDLCNTLEEISPYADLTINEITCANQEITVDPSNSSGYNQHAWKVCKLDNNDQEIDCVTTELTIGTIPGLFNVETFYTNGGASFDCDQKYRVVLTLANDCVGEVDVSQDFYLDCDSDNSIDYQDIIVCGTNNIDVLMEGDNHCDGCTFEWSPGQYLDDENIEFPTIQGSVNGLALSSDYVVSATNETGCVFEEEVMVVQVEDLSVTAIVEIEQCDFTFFAEIHSVDPISVSFFEDLLFINETKNETYTGVLQGDPGGLSTSWLYRLEGLNFSRNEIHDDTWRVEVGFNPAINVTGNCMLQDYFPPLEQTDLYFGAFTFQMPNAFTPNGDTVNATFGPASEYEGNDILNAYAARMRVWDRWGELVWDSGLAEAEIGTLLDRDKISWDGTCNQCGDGTEDEILPSDVYVYILDLENCDNPLGTINYCTTWCRGGDFIPGQSLCNDEDDCAPYTDANGILKDPDCDGCEWTGDVTLIL